MSNTRHARYIGPRNQMRGRTCLVRAPGKSIAGSTGMYLAQFDDTSLLVAGVSVGHGWHPIKPEYLRWI